MTSGDLAIPRDTDYWHGSQRLIDDSHSMLRLLRDRYPDKALFLLGESMGGAVALTALKQEKNDI